MILPDDMTRHETPAKKRRDGGMEGARGVVQIRPSAQELQSLHKDHEGLQPLREFGGLLI